MKTFLIILTSAVLCYAEESGKTSDWAKTQWGMTDQQVRAIYPDAVVVSPKARGKPPPKEAKLKLESYLIGRDSFEVKFFFDADGGLDEVDVSKDAKYDWELLSTLHNLEDLLTQKYGPPSLRAPERDGGLRVLWSKSDLSVALHYSPFPTLSKFMLYIAYKRPKPKTLDRL